MGAARLGRLRPQPVFVAIGPSGVQLKRLIGLPAGLHVRVLRQVVETSEHRYFVCREPGLVGGVESLRDGPVWATRFDRGTIESVQRGVATSGARVRSAVPSVVALTAASNGTRARVRDGRMRVEVQHKATRLERIEWCIDETNASDPSRRSANHASDELSAVPELAVLGADAATFAAAYGAVVLGGHHPLAYRLPRSARAEGHVEHISKWRLCVAVAACAVGIAGALVAPVARARRDESAARERLVAMNAAYRRALAAERSIADLSEIVEGVGAFERSRHARTSLLVAVARAIPADGFVASLRADSSAVTITVLAPRAARVLETIDGLPGVTGAEIAGPITREVIAGREVERATIQFRLGAGFGQTAGVASAEPTRVASAP